jgi:hypothetical protein
MARAHGAQERPPLSQGKGRKLNDILSPPLRRRGRVRVGALS